MPHPKPKRPKNLGNPRERLLRATITAPSLEAKQDSGNIDKTQTKATYNEPSSQGTSLGDGPRCQDTMGISLLILGIEDVGEEGVVEVVTTAKMIIDAAQVTTAIADIPVSAAEIIVTTAPTITVESTKTNVEVTQTPKRKRVMIQDPKETTTTIKIASSQQPQVQDKGKRKAKLIEEPEMPKKRKHQIIADKELAKKLHAKMQAKIDEEDRLAKDKAQTKQEANDALINTWDDIQAKINKEESRSLRRRKGQELTSSKDCIKLVYFQGIEDVGEEGVVEVVTTAKMIIDAAQVTTAIADIPVSAAEIIVTTAPTITVESTKTNVEVTQTPKRKRVIIQDPKETTTTIKIASSQQPQVQDKGKRKAKLIEEPEMPKKRKHQIIADKELAKKLHAKMQAKIDEEDRLAKDKAQTKQEANDALINTWDDIQAKINKAEAEITQECSLKRTGEELDQERPKKQKMEVDKESKELKQCLEIISDDEDEITTAVGHHGKDLVVSTASIILVFFCEYRNGDIPFRNWLFTEKIGYDVKIIDLFALFDDEEKFSILSDADAIRLCLLLSLEGEHIWRQLYDSIRNVSSKHKLEHLAGLKRNPNHVLSYSLTGFLFCLLLVYRIVGGPKWSKIIPRALSWRRKAEFNQYEYFGELFISIEQLANQKNVLNSLMIEKYKSVKPWIEDISSPFKRIDKIFLSHELQNGFCALNDNRKGWLLDETDMDWAMVSSYFLPLLLQGFMPLFYANNDIYPVPWSNVERMRDCLEEKIPVVLKGTGVFEKKNIDPAKYKISFKVANGVPKQGRVFADCGVFLCILANGIPLALDDPLQSALAYREKLIHFYFKHKMLCP
uniref:Ulp1 protease family, C-terminal catalytic domain-containing protein n=1 Tax=Tanacetum cinerariifolium TaxID=118510 RepID=A0A6L2MB79_TANCI|nr:hypothetical protein [Tanacetum cinerariifolium]